VFFKRRVLLRLAQVVDHHFLHHVVQGNFGYPA
jgi:hypothetical protein